MLRQLGVAVERTAPTNTKNLLGQAQKAEESVALKFNERNCPKPDRGESDLRGMPKDMSEFYEPWPDYEWLDKRNDGMPAR
jgi:hypothetical protein